ncbi:MAG: ABC transporter ATP-binding protein [Elusimicrobiota bacterium]
MDIVRFESLSKVYRLPGFFKSKKVSGVHDLSFSISEGEIFGLLGLNGSGKTTSMRLLLGLIRPSQGRALVLGQEAAFCPDVRAQIGYLPENASFPGALTAREVLRFLGRIDRSKFDGRMGLERRIEEVLRVVGLDRAAERKTSGYSKGMIQRLGVAQAILHRPKVLVLDEPASGLDPLGIVEMRGLFLKLNQDFGITVIFSSHSIGEVEKISHRAAIIAGNRLSRILEREDWQAGSPKSLEAHFLECAQAVD